MPRNTEVIRQWTILREIERARTAGVTIDELAALCDVTTRTIRRDLQALEEAGYPLFDDKDSIMYEFIPAIPSATWAQPEEIAKLAALMASGEVPFMHGACVVADGGWTIK